MKPYIVSADICLLIKNWAIKNGFLLPEQDFFCQLRKGFSNHMQEIFPQFEFVSEEEISYGLDTLVVESSLPTISLDHVYFTSELNLEITRLVDKDGNDQGLGHRFGTPSLTQQIRKLKMNGVHKAIIVDDVIFTGALLERIIELLSKVDIRVPLVCAGIGIAEGIKRISGTRREICCVRTYGEAIDEVCERDFYPGVPLSGRLLAGSNNIGVPYLLPFGKPESWASIPSEYVKTFSRFCLHQTISLFDEVERCSGKQVLCQDLGRKVVGLPTDETQYTSALHKIL